MKDFSRNLKFMGLFLYLVTNLPSALYGVEINESNIRVVFEDVIGLDGINSFVNDFDSNDVVMCNGIKASGPSIHEMTQATISIKAEA